MASATICDVDRRRQPDQASVRVHPGFQPLPVSAHIPWRFVVNLRGDARRWAAYVPKPLALELVGGEALISVCVLAIERMGVVGLPRFLRFDSLEMLYRVAVRAPHAGGSLRSFATLRSDVSARAMQVLGARFSHYVPRAGAFAGGARGAGVELSCVDDDGRTARFCAPFAPAARPESSVFSSLDAAVAAVLGVDGSVSVGPRGAVRFQPISHPPWAAAFAAPTARDFPVLTALAAGTPLAYDSTLLLREQTQTWHAMRKLRQRP